MTRRWGRRRVDDATPPPRSEETTTVPTMVDPDRQSELERFGFTVLPVFDDDLLAAVRQTSEAMGPAPDDPQVALNWSFHSGSREHKASVKGLLPSVLPALDAVFVDHVAYLTTFITKWPGPHSAFPPHQDPTLVDERRFTGVTVWIPLHAVDGTNGMLHVVPGSHRFSRALRGQDVDRSPFADLPDATIEAHGRGVPLAAGEAIVFDNRLLHYSRPNVSEQPRVVLSFGLRPRAARCVVVRPADDGRLEVHEVPDDFYIDVLPALRDRWDPSAEPIALVAEAKETWSPESFAARCRAVGPAPHTVASVAGAGLGLDAGVFCARCGSSEGLSERDREGRGNAQLLCPGCVAALAAEAATPR